MTSDQKEVVGIIYHQKKAKITGKISFELQIKWTNNHQVFSRKISVGNCSTGAVIR